MSAESTQNTILYVILVLFLMIGAAGLGIMSVMLDTGDKDYMQSHDYEVDSGTYLGVAANGTGNSQYYNESSKEYLYQFTTTLSNGTVTFDVICDSDKIPITQIYTKGESATLDDTQCTWWSFDPRDGHCEFAIDEKMIVHQYVMTAPDGTWSFTANLKNA